MHSAVPAGSYVYATGGGMPQQQQTGHNTQSMGNGQHAAAAHGQQGMQQYMTMQPYPGAVTGQHESAQAQYGQYGAHYYAVDPQYDPQYDVSQYDQAAGQMTYAASSQGFANGHGMYAANGQMTTFQPNGQQVKGRVRFYHPLLRASRLKPAVTHLNPLHPTCIVGAAAAGHSERPVSTPRIEDEMRAQAWLLLCRAWCTRRPRVSVCSAREVCLYHMLGVP